MNAKEVAEWLSENRDRFCVAHRAGGDEHRVQLLVLGVQGVQYVEQMDAVMIVTAHIGQNIIEVSKKDNNGKVQQPNKTRRATKKRRR